jgi:hypothetical protein
MFAHEENWWMLLILILVICFIYPPIMGLFFGMMGFIVIRYALQIIFSNLP